MISNVKIKHYRKEKHMTQEQLAELAGITASYLSQIETGRREIGRQAFEKIAAALEMPDSVFLKSTQRDEELQGHKIYDILEDCNRQELDVLCDAIVGLKQVLRKNKLCID